MVIVGLGANLPSQFGLPKETIEAALSILEGRGVQIIALSGFYESAPVPLSNQPWYVNAAARIETELEPLVLLRVLKSIEKEMGREIGEKNAARVIDLDLLVYNDFELIDETLILPHPRMHARAFVLFPMKDLVSDKWRHPAFNLTVDEMISNLDENQVIRPLAK